MMLYSKYANLASMLAKKKYNDRKPKMANILELNTKNGSAVMDKIAGTLSKAKTTSIISMTSKAINKGVANRLPCSRIKN